MKRARAGAAIAAAAAVLLSAAAPASSNSPDNAEAGAEVILHAEVSPYLLEAAATGQVFHEGQAEWAEVAGKSYAQRNGVTLDVARAALGVQLLALDAYAAMERVDPLFAGMEVDAGDTLGRIRIATAGDPVLPDEVAELVEPIGEVSVEQVPAGRDAVREAVQQAKAAADDDGLVADFDADALNGEVTAFVPSPEAQEFARDWPWPEGLEVAIVEGSIDREGPEHIPSAGDGCQSGSRSHCNPLRGGIRLDLMSGSGYCTMVYHVYLPSNPSRRFFKNARHSHDGTRPHTGERANTGGLYDQDNSGGADWQVYEMKSGWSTWKNYMYFANGAQQAYQIEQVWTSTGFPIGNNVSMGGAKTDFGIGPVEDDCYGSRCWLRWDRDPPSNSGDSGAPTVMAFWALASHGGSFGGAGSGGDQYASWIYFLRAGTQLEIRTQTAP